MGLPALAENYLFLGPVIQARLVDQVADCPVDVCETVEQLLAADRRAIVLMVMWGGDRFSDGEAGRAGNGASQVFHQRWMVALALNHVGKTNDARHARAGALLSATQKALAGHVPAGCARPLLRVNAPMRPDINAAKAIYPMGFEIQLSL